MGITSANRRLARKYVTALFGHGIKCVFCGWQLTNHRKGIEEGEHPERRKRGFPFSLSKCPGYAPMDEEEWQRLDAAVPLEERQRAAEGIGYSEDLNIC